MNTSHLKQAISLASKAVSTRTSLPILGHLYLEKEGDKLTIVGTDLVEYLSIQLQADPTKPDFSLAVPATTLRDWINEVTGDDTKITVTGFKMKISVGHSTASFNGMNGGEYPTRSHPIEPSPITIRHPAASLYSALKAVGVCAAKDDSRPALSGIHFNGSRLESADGYRLAVANTIPMEGNVIIPPSSTLLTLLKDYGTVIVTIDERRAEFYFQNDHFTISYSTQLIPANFPDVDQIVPRPVGTMVIDRNDLLGALNTALIYVKDTTSKTVVLHPSPTTLRVVAVSPELGDCESTIAPTGIVMGSLPQAIAFNARYLKDIVSAATTDLVSLQFSSDTPNTPLVIREEGYDDTPTWVVMPMHLGAERP